MPGLAVTLTTAPNDAVRLLIGELEDVLAAEYPPGNRHGWRLKPSSSRTCASLSRRSATPPSGAGALSRA